MIELQKQFVVADVVLEGKKDKEVPAHNEVRLHGLELFFYIESRGRALCSYCVSAKRTFHVVYFRYYVCTKAE